MKSPIKILAIAAIVIGCILLDSEYRWMPWWDKEPATMPVDTTVNTWVVKDTLGVDSLKKDTVKTDSKIVK